MSFKITDYNHLPAGPIPDAPALSEADTLAKQVDALRKKAVQQVRKFPPVDTEEALNAFKRSESEEQQKKSELKNILADPRLELVESLLWGKNEERQEKVEGIASYFEKDFLPNFEAILSHLGPIKINEILENLLLLNTQTNNRLQALIGHLGKKLGLWTVIKQWEVFSDDWEIATARKEKTQRSLWNLLIEVDDLCTRYPALEQLLPKTLSHLFFFFKKMRTIAFIAIDRGTEAFKQSENGIGILDAGDGGQFSKLLKNYSSLDMARARPLILEKILLPLLPTCGLSDECQLEAQLGSTYYNMSEYGLKRGEAYTLAFLQATLTDRYAWLKRNRSHVKKSYSQDDDPHRNLGTGTCAQNSCMRQAILLENPAAGIEALPLGSSPTGRRVKATLNLEVAFQYGNNLGRASVTAKSAIDVFAPFGLKKREYRESENGLAHLGQLLKEHPEPFLLHLSGNRPGAHEINVQCDPKVGKYRFIDDNIGIVEYESQDEFIAELKEFLKVFYNSPKIGARFLSLAHSPTK